MLLYKRSVLQQLCFDLKDSAVDFVMNITVADGNPDMGLILVLI